MDTQLVDNIVHEVKSQGVFDEFRKDSMADVDTKPAYQNLRQRVENTVKKFLSEQKWTPETNKNQLREKLRRHITESGFLDVGVERIVDQVVNPKIGSVFQPRIEEIAYKYLGLPPPPKKFEPPPPPLMHPFPPLPLNAPPLKVETCSLLPTDLEQVSPDSDNATVKSGDKDDKTIVDMDTEEKLIEDEDESPPFEPLIKQEVVEIKDEVKTENQEDIKQDINVEYKNSFDVKTNKFEESNDGVIKTEILATENESQDAINFATESAYVDKEASQSVDARISQDSQLSSVSSNSRLSANAKEDSLQSSSQEAVAANISEEAQMPKFNENSCEPIAANGNTFEKEAVKSELHFDIKKDEIKFEGTERKTGLETPEPSVDKSEEEKYLPLKENSAVESKNDSFQFAPDKSSLEPKEEDCERTPNAQELSFGSSVDDSSSIPPSQTPKCSTNKVKDDSPIIQTPTQSVRPNTPTTNYECIPTPPLPTPTATPSPVATQKSDRDHQSRYSSSSSKHKKHSKERRRSYEHEKEKDSRNRHRSNKDSYKYRSSSGTKSSTKHSSSSSSSKYYSSHKSTDKDIEKSSSSSTHYSMKHTKHLNSHSSSSSNENQDSKKSKRDPDRRRNSSFSSSSKRSERKDDHAEAKHKIHRRKSTDSNDDEGDKSIGGGSKSGSQHKSSSHSLSSGSKSSKSKSGGSENYKSSNDGPKDQMEIQEFTGELSNTSKHVYNVVILNDLLENPQTQFIQLNNKGHLVETPLQQQPPSNNIIDCKLAAFAEFNNNIEPFVSKKEKKEVESDSDSMDLLYFEEIQLNLTERLQLLNVTMDLCRGAVNSLRFDSLSDEGIELSNEEDVNIDNNKINLLTESLKRKSDFNFEEFETTPRKRVLSNESEGCQMENSPTPSDTSSVNSKENEEIPKNTYHAKKSLVDRHKAVQKLTQQQRYSSEDLYKPRPILGQRSRRRGMDSLV